MAQNREPHKHCPRCDQPYIGEGAESRHCDLEICPICGLDEAMAEIGYLSLSAAERAEKDNQRLKKYCEANGIEWRCE